MDFQGARLWGRCSKVGVLLLILLMTACGGGSSSSSDTSSTAVASSSSVSSQSSSSLSGQSSSSVSSQSSSLSASSSSSRTSAAGSWINAGPSLYIFPSLSAISLADYGYATGGKQQYISLSIQNRPITASYLVWRYSGSAISSVQLSWPFETQAGLAVFFKPASTLAAGTYHDVLQIQLCEDVDCVTPQTRSFLEIPITFTVVPVTGTGAPTLVLNPSAIDFTATSVGPFGESFGNRGVAFNFNMSNLLDSPYVSASVQGIATAVSVTNTITSVSGLVTLPSTQSLNVGDYTGVLTLKVCLDGMACAHQMQGSPFQIPVNYHVTDAYIQPGTYGFSWRVVPIAASDIAWDPTAQRIYATESNTDGSHTGYLTRVNPITKAIDWRFALGVMPSRLAVSPDGFYAYVWTMEVAADLSQSNQQLRKYRLSDQALMWTIALPDKISDFKVSPGNGSYLALSSSNTGLYLYATDSGLLIDAYATPGGFPDAIVWGASESVLYSYDPLNDLLRKFVPSMSSFGYQSNTHVDLNSDQEAWSGLHYGNGQILENHGAIYDIAAGAVSSRLNIRTETNDASFKPYSIASELDMNIGRSYFWYVNGSSVIMQVFDLGTRSSLAWFATSSRSTFRLMRWGTDGLAYLHSGISSQDSGIALVQGKFVSPGM
ncbi:MAG: hypothetical protein QM808_06520 [Steroidobacteraceae bacterium]